MQNTKRRRHINRENRDKKKYRCIPLWNPQLKPLIETQIETLSYLQKNKTLVMNIQSKSLIKSLWNKRENRDITFVPLWNLTLTFSIETYLQFKSNPNFYLRYPFNFTLWLAILPLELLRYVTFKPSYFVCEMWKWEWMCECRVLVLEYNFGRGKICRMFYLGLLFLIYFVNII